MGASRSGQRSYDVFLSHRDGFAREARASQYVARLAKLFRDYRGHFVHFSGHGTPVAGECISGSEVGNLLVVGTTSDVPQLRPAPYDDLVDWRAMSRTSLRERLLRELKRLGKREEKRGALSRGELLSASPLALHIWQSGTGSIRRGVKTFTEGLLEVRSWSATRPFENFWPYRVSYRGRALSSTEAMLARHEYRSRAIRRLFEPDGPFSIGSSMGDFWGKPDIWTQVVALTRSSPWYLQPEGSSPYTSTFAIAAAWGGVTMRRKLADRIDPRRDLTPHSPRPSRQILNASRRLPAVDRAVRRDRLRPAPLAAPAPHAAARASTVRHLSSALRPISSASVHRSVFAGPRMQRFLAA